MMLRTLDLSILMRKLEDLEDRAKKEKIRLQISEFLAGYGNITYDGALLTCAQISSRKNYTFNPTVLKNVDEFKEYLNILSAAKKPIRERFIIAPQKHWICGDIKIDDDGKANIVFLESLGIKKDFGPRLLIDITFQSAKAFLDTFPGSLVWVSKETRQHASKGCSIFTFDDMQHLFTIEKYLGENYKDTGLFGYIASQPLAQFPYAMDSHLGSIMARECHLPLSFERTMQSVTTLSTMLTLRDENEQKQPLNKSGLTALQFMQEKKFFQPNSDNKVQNTRLDHVLKKITAQNLQYLLETDINEVEMKIRDFTLDALRARMLEPTRQLSNK